jgi:hypothetical protein
MALSALPEGQSGLAAGAYDTFRQAGVALGTAALGHSPPASGALGGGRAAAYVGGLHRAVLFAVTIAAVGTIADVMLIGRWRTPLGVPGRLREITEAVPTGVEMPQEEPPITRW